MGWLFGVVTGTWSSDQNFNFVHCFAVLTSEKGDTISLVAEHPCREQTKHTDLFCRALKPSCKEGRLRLLLVTEMHS